MAGVKRTRSKVSKAKPKKATRSAAKKPAAKKPAAKPKGKGKATVPTKTKKRDKKDEDKEEEKIEERKLVMTNGVPVDHKVPNITAHEVVSHQGVVLNCHLMFADCGHNNNKFYIIQGLKSGAGYFLWTRWGRVGVDGQIARTP